MYAFIALMPFIWRSRRKSFSNSADTPSIARCSGDLAGFGPSGRCGTISVSPGRRNCISVSNSLRPWWLEPEAFSALETTVPAARLEYLSQLVVTELGRAADGSGCRPKKGARGEQADNGGMSLRHVARPSAWTINAYVTFRKSKAFTRYPHQMVGPGASARYASCGTTAHPDVRCTPPQPSSLALPRRLVQRRLSLV
jgi:hypothetical protein